jgi:DNA primase
VIQREMLRRMRNEVPIGRALALAQVPVKESEGYLRFLCPLCGEFNTATNPRTNLGRCFRCQRNFNPIDLVMAAEGSSFIDAVRRLTPLLSG